MHYPPNIVKKHFPGKVMFIIALEITEISNSFFAKKDFFYESFFPSSIRLWNNLNFNLRDIQSLNEFKSKLNRKISKNFNKACLWHAANSAVQHSRMRMGLSALNSQRKAYNFISEDLCPNCHEKKETVTHFFFECPFYAAFKQEMLQNVEIIIQDYSSVETSDLVKLFLYGTGIFEIDVNLFEKIQNYIFQTRRFVFKQ